MPNIGWQELMLLGILAIPVAIIVLVARSPGGRKKTAELEAQLGRPAEPGERVYKPQGNGPRLLAFIIDLVIFGTVVGLLAMVGAALSGAALESLTGGILAVIMVVVWFAYFAGLEAVLSRTIGKMALGLRVIGANGQPCGWGQAFARNITKALATYSLLGLILTSIFIGRSATAQRLGDRLAGTTVVKDVTEAYWRNLVDPTQEPVKPMHE
jgi:uncharacterized RDD family membrane protein YckC